MSYKILSINPGSTSTKVALYEDDQNIFTEMITHYAEDIQKFDDILDQVDFRADFVHSALAKHDVRPAELSAVVGRGGLIPNMRGGGYLVNEEMIDVIRSGKASPHASNLGALLAQKIAGPLGINAYIYDAVTTNEFPDIAAVTGMPDVRRDSKCHVLNMKAVSRRVAVKYGKSFEDMRLIVAHMGGGISISAIENGRIIDSIGDDAGPFAPERSGSIPLFYIIDMCYSGLYSKKEMSARIRGQGGLKAYFGTADCRVIEEKIADGDEHAKLMYEAMAYQVAKGIGELAPVLRGKIDCTILTGGLAWSTMFLDMLRERIGFLAPVEIVAGEDEMEALSLGVLRILRGDEPASEYGR